MCAGNDLQIWPTKIGCEIRLGCTMALAVFVGHLILPYAFLFRAVEVRIDGKACLSARVHKK